MAIPDYQKMFVPLLRIVAENGTMRIRDCYSLVADQIGLSDSEREKLLPSGKMPVVDNRVQWAKLYLIKAGLLESPKRGYISITPRGQSELKANPNGLDRNYLRKYPEFDEFLNPKKSVDGETKTVVTQGEDVEEKTPEEKLEEAFQEIQDSLAADILEAVKKASPRFFEELVVKILVAMGYGGSLRDAGSVVGKAGDEGIDGIIKEDFLGLDQIYIQAKRWENVVSRPEIQKFVGALQGKRARKGVFLTTSYFSKDALEYTKILDVRVVLIDGDRLARLMIEHDVGVSREVSYSLKRIDTDFFDDD